MTDGHDSIVTRPPSEGSMYISTEDFILRLSVTLGAAYVALLGATLAFVALAVSAILPPQELGLLVTIILSFLISVFAVKVFNHLRKLANEMFGEVRHQSITGLHNDPDRRVLPLFALFLLSSFIVFLGTQLIVQIEAIPDQTLLSAMMSNQYNIISKLSLIVINLQSATMITLFGANFYGIGYRLKLRFKPNYYCNECGCQVSIDSSYCDNCGDQLELVD